MDPFEEQLTPSLPPPEATPKPPRKRRWLARALKIVLVIAVLAAALFSYEIISSGSSPTEVLVQIGRLITSRDRELQGEDDGRINILLLGIGGSGHEGPLLTDSMLLISFRPATNQVALISVPRDLLAPIPGYGQRRINNAYALPELNRTGAGGPTVRAVVADIFGIPIHYSLLLDFAGFTELVDSLGGVTVDVEQTLDDEYYPVPGKEMASDAERYEHLYIPAGRQHLDGMTALKYVRSRKAKGAQGSDFARSHRQQQVISAIRDQATAWGVLRPGRLGELLRILNAHMDTNLEAWEMLRLYQLARKVNPDEAVKHVLDDRPDGVLMATFVEGAYVLVPRTGDFSQLRSIALDPFQPLPVTQALQAAAVTASSTAPATSKLPPVSSAPRVQIHNGTTIAGLAARTESYLRGKGYQVVSVGNAPVQTYLKTVVYDLRPPAGAKALRALGELLSGITFDSGPPPLPHNNKPYPVHPQADLLIILGQNLDNLLPAEE